MKVLNSDFTPSFYQLQISITAYLMCRHSLIQFCTKVRSQLYSCFLLVVCYIIVQLLICGLINFGDIIMGTSSQHACFGSFCEDGKQLCNIYSGLVPMSIIIAVVFPWSLDPVCIRSNLHICVDNTSSFFVHCMLHPCRLIHRNSWNSITLAIIIGMQTSETCMLHEPHANLN